MSNPANSDLPVAVIGGGPVGLAAAAHLVTRGVPVTLYEAGEIVAAHVRDWGHVRLFSPWSFNADHAARRLADEDAEARLLLREEFGPEIFSATGDLNRAALRAIVFANQGKKRALERIERALNS